MPAFLLLERFFPWHFLLANPERKARLLATLSSSEQVALYQCDCLMAFWMGRLKGAVFLRYQYKWPKGTYLLVEKLWVPPSFPKQEMEEKLMGYLRKLAKQEQLLLEQDSLPFIHFH